MITRKEKATIGVYQIELDKSIQNEDAAMLQFAGKEPLLWYNGLLIPSGFISSFYLDTNGFFPVLNVFFKDRTDEMKGNGFALDNTVISIYLDSRTKDAGGSPALAPIRMDFKIVDFGYLEDEKLHFIKGYPNIDGLFLQKIQAFKGKTSFDVLKEIAKSIKLGFSTNINGTDDAMNWMNVGMENYQFIQDTTTKVYKNESSFFTSFIDYYYNLNFVDIEEQLKDDINNQKGILTANNIGYNEDKAQVMEDLYLISSKTYTNSYNNTIETYEVNNKSTKISLKNGYRTELYYYDKTGNWNEKAGTFIKFTLETNTDGKGIVLKSYPKDNKADGFFNKNTKKVDLTPLDIDNTHKHYNYASILNDYNLDEINKVTMTATLNSPNFNFYKYQKIKVLIFEPRIDKDSPSEILNKRLSGGWLITAINFRFSPEEGLKQEIKMIKRELTAENINY